MDELASRIAQGSGKTLLKLKRHISAGAHMNDAFTLKISRIYIGESSHTSNCASSPDPVHTAPFEDLMQKMAADHPKRQVDNRSFGAAAPD